ncbi:hypothetical protein Ahy_B10g104319 [Arachis hypogaea]|uniref:SWIM-type domain-containing protein n=1 Tax=Arachis hypogaea TaxID=3818 RepID=A0A444X579_ARAHY|nr:hypothetical protein Ahy_B10g104319 [Arachis hypogaea]
MFNKFVVTYDVISCEVKCQCLLFESRGILCRHSLSTLSFERFDKVASKYIFKNIKKRHTHIKSSQDEPLLEPRSKRFDDLVFRSHHICELALEFEELTGILHCTFDNVMAKIQEYQAKVKVNVHATLNDVIDLQSSLRVRTRGCPKNRLGSNMEKKIANASEKKKKTALSELNLLDGGSMIQSSSSLYHAQDMNYPREDMTHYDRSFGL